MFAAIEKGHLSIVELLLNYDNDLLERTEGGHRPTPLLTAIEYRQCEIAHFLLDRGANALVTTEYMSTTTLMCACEIDPKDVDLEMVRRLLAAGVDIEARDRHKHTALHYAAMGGDINLLRELIVEHNANIFAVETSGETPFDLSTTRYDETCAFLIECYGIKLTKEHGCLALHAVLSPAEYSFIEDEEDWLHPPLKPTLQVHLPLGTLAIQHFRTLLSTLDPELIRNRDESGQLPIHIACRNKAPVEILAMIVEMDPTMLQIADYNGALPLHECCCGAVDHSSVRHLVEQANVRTLDARNQDGALPLHLL